MGRMKDLDIEQQNEEAAFPVDWTAWRAQWQAWRARHRADLRPTSARLAGRNIMADEVLGTWSVRGRVVELSEVTFPDLDTRMGRKRYVGLTFAGGALGDRGTVVETFGELERALGLEA